MYDFLLMFYGNGLYLAWFPDTTVTRYRAFFRAPLYAPVMGDRDRLFRHDTVLGQKQNSSAMLRGNKICLMRNLAFRYTVV